MQTVSRLERVLLLGPGHEKSRSRTRAPGSRSQAARHRPPSPRGPPKRGRPKGSTGISRRHPDSVLAAEIAKSPLATVYASQTASSYHAVCKHPLEFQGRRAQLELDFYCLRCMEHVALPQFALSRIRFDLPRPTDATFRSGPRASSPTSKLVFSLPTSLKGPAQPGPFPFLPRHGIIAASEAALKIETVEDPADPRIASFRDARDGELRRREGLFLAEGRLLVRRLLETLRFPVQSLLVTPPALDDLRDLLADDDSRPFHVASPETIRAIVGFKFHRGCLALGVRGEPDPVRGAHGARGPADIAGARRA